MFCRAGWLSLMLYLLQVNYRLNICAKEYLHLITDDTELLICYHATREGLNVCDC